MPKQENYILRFLRSTGILFIGVILPKVVVFLLLSFNTAHIGTADYGYYDLSVNITTMITYLLYFDIWISTMRFLYEKEGDEAKDPVLRSGNRIFLLSTLAFCAVGILFCILRQPRYGIDILLMGLLQNLTNMYTFSARGYGKDVDFAVSGVLGSFSLGVLNYGLIRWMGWDFHALYVSASAGYLVQCLYLEIRCGYLRRIRSSRYDKDLTKEIFRFTLPMGVGAMAFWVLNSFDKIVLASVLDLESGGIYAVAERLAGLITFAVQCFTYAWQDIAFRHKSENEGAFYHLATKLYILFLSAGIAMILPALSIVFPYIIGADFSGASLIIPAAILAATLSGYSLFLNNIFYALHETKTGTATSLVSGAFNLIICYPCITRFHLAGASIAITCSFLLDSVLKSIFLKKKIGYTAPWSAILCAVAIVTLACAVYYFCGPVLNGIWLLICLAVSAFFAWKLLGVKRETK
ncbi:MAG: polysaccharide biosynthesis C-terminal domain-containing protein [Oscillospiraceae bacterium]|nr:polysaccharide biosynthesis C-terminal domain-containing protein [Oscillospiraceae bacterium]